MVLDIILTCVGIFPAILLVYLTWKMDKEHIHSFATIIYAMLYGVLAALLSYYVTDGLQRIFNPELTSVWKHLYENILLAALPEESIKYFLMLLFMHLHGNRQQYMSILVFSVCIAMGFAGFENIMYLAKEKFIGGEWTQLLMLRTITSIPGHYSFAIFMGTFYALAIRRGNKNVYFKHLAYFVPILAHSFFNLHVAHSHDSFLMQNIHVVFFWIFCVALFRASWYWIRNMMVIDRDKDDIVRFTNYVNNNGR